MSDRDARLLPRLMSSLDTLEGDAEIANVVRRIRKAAGKDFFTSQIADIIPLPSSTILLDHPEREISLRLRGLGLLLRLAQHSMPEINAAIHRTREALVNAGEVERSDLLVTLACLRDMIDREAANQMHMPHHSETLAADLRCSMDVLFRQMRGI